MSFPPSLSLLLPGSQRLQGMHGSIMTFCLGSFLVFNRVIALVRAQVTPGALQKGHA
jgi:hypothetical protein